MITLGSKVSSQNPFLLHSHVMGSSKKQKKEVFLSFYYLVNLTSLVFGILFMEREKDFHEDTTSFILFLTRFRFASISTLFASFFFALIPSRLIAFHEPNEGHSSGLRHKFARKTRIMQS